MCDRQVTVDAMHAPMCHEVEGLLSVSDAQSLAKSHYVCLTTASLGVLGVMLAISIIYVVDRQPANTATVTPYFFARGCIEQWRVSGSCAMRARNVVWPARRPESGKVRIAVGGAP